MPVLSTQLDGVDLVKARVSTASYVGLWSVLSWELGVMSRQQIGRGFVRGFRL